MQRQAVCGGLPAAMLGVARRCEDCLPLAAQVRALGIHARFTSGRDVERIIAREYKFVAIVTEAVRISYLREGREVANA